MTSDSSERVYEALKVGLVEMQEPGTDQQRQVRAKLIMELLEDYVRLKIQDALDELHSRYDLKFRDDY